MWASCGYLIGTAFPVWMRIVMVVLPDTAVTVLVNRVLPWAIGAVLVSVAVPFLARRPLTCLSLGLLGSLPFGVFLVFTGY